MANELLQLRVRGSMDGQNTENVLHYLVQANTLTPAKTDGQIMMEKFSSTIINLKWFPLVSSAWVFHGLSAQQIPNVPGVVFPEDLDDSLQGTVGSRTGDYLPSYASMLLSKRTVAGGRRARGRLYIAGVAESIVSTGKLTSTGLADLAALGTSLTAILDEGLPGGGAYQPVVFSRTNWKRGINPILTLITRYVAHSALATTRSRKI